MARLVLLIFALIAAAHGDSASASAAAGREVAIILKPYVGRLLTADVEIDGHPARLLFDTGGGLTMITPELAQAIGCKPHGRWIGFRMSGERVESRKCGAVQVRINGYSKRLSAGVFDLMKMLPAGLPKVDGVLSLDSFDGERISIDLKEKSLTVRPSSIPLGSVEGELRLMREMSGVGLTAFAVAKAKVGTLRLLIDSGNIDRVVLSPGAIEQLGSSPVADGEGMTVSLELVGRRPEQVDVKVADVIYDGALDFETLSAHAFTLDLAHSQIWYHPEAD